MPGETDLDRMLSSLELQLLSEGYVFCTVPDGVYGAFETLKPIASVQEVEGLTLVLQQDHADQAGLSYDGVFSCIRLGVHSSLHAIGLTAAVSRVLAEGGVSANMFAGFYHDHVFVPAAHADRAIRLLEGLRALS